MSQISDLVSSNLREVFGQRDAEARRHAMERLFTPDIRFADHNGVAVGIDAIDAQVQALQDATPGFVFSEAGPVSEVQDLGTVDWHYGPAGADPVVTGTDVVVVRDGRISALWVYLTTPE